jgi:hypothetical protein
MTQTTRQHSLYEVREPITWLMQKMHAIEDFRKHGRIARLWKRQCIKQAEILESDKMTIMAGTDPSTGDTVGSSEVWK